MLHGYKANGNFGIFSSSRKRYYDFYRYWRLKPPIAIERVSAIYLMLLLGEGIDRYMWPADQAGFATELFMKLKIDILRILQLLKGLARHRQCYGLQPKVALKAGSVGMFNNKRHVIDAAFIL